MNSVVGRDLPAIAQVGQPGRQSADDSLELSPPSVESLERKWIALCSSRGSDSKRSLKIILI